VIIEGLIIMEVMESNERQIEKYAHEWLLPPACEDDSSDPYYHFHFDSKHGSYELPGTREAFAEHPIRECRSTLLSIPNSDAVGIQILYLKLALRHHPSRFHVCSYYTAHASQLQKLNLHQVSH
jgi:hypothetical protein